jgi:hypothetical protein
VRNSIIDGNGNADIPQIERIDAGEGRSRSEAALRQVSALADIRQVPATAADVARQAAHIRKGEEALRVELRFTCFTRTKVQILTPEGAAGGSAGGQPQPAGGEIPKQPQLEGLIKSCWNSQQRNEYTVDRDARGLEFAGLFQRRESSCEIRREGRSFSAAGREPWWNWAAFLGRPELTEPS